MRKRKTSPAELRTLGLFNGSRTPLEEAEDMLHEEEETAHPHAARDYDSVKHQMIDTTIHWLGMDAFEDGDDVLLAIGPKGDGVLMAVTAAKGNYPGRQTHVRLSKKQLRKLKNLADQIP